RRHPLQVMLMRAPVSALAHAGVARLSAVRAVVGVIAGTWTLSAFALLRLTGFHRKDALLLTLLMASSSASIFWIGTPESFALGATSILLSLATVNLARRFRHRSEILLVIGNVVSLSVTVTNWMSGMIAAFVTCSPRRALQIVCNALVVT